MTHFVGVAVQGLFRTVAVVVLAMLAVANLAGLLLWAVGRLAGADVRVNGGALTVIVGIVVLVLCLGGMRALIHPRPR